MTAVVATILLSVAVGAALERRYGEGAHRGARLALLGMLYTLLPFVAYFNVARMHIDVSVGAGLALGWVTLAIAALTGWLLARRALHLPRPRAGSVATAAAQANTGFVGAPLAAALLGSSHVGEAVAYDALVSVPFLFLVIFGIGAATGTRSGETTAQRVRTFVLRNPPLLAVAVALVVPNSLAPDSLLHVSRIAVFALIPVGFAAVGVHLAAEHVPLSLTPPVATAVLLRVLAAPLILAALALPFLRLPRTYLLMAAMPTGVNALTAAHNYGMDVAIPAATIAWTTGIVLLAGLIASAVL